MACSAAHGDVQMLEDVLEDVAQAGEAERDLQFYVTPDHLADRLWGMFSGATVDRLLDAAAGTGALADAYVRSMGNRAWAGRDNTLPIDVIEIDARHHPALRGKGYRLAAMDFLTFEGLASYSHIVVNPPFLAGAKFVLKGWDGLWTGEIGAIVNATTIRNPCTAERKRLVKLIEKHGTVEFVEDAFADSETKARVDVALIHLSKPAQEATDWIQPMIDGLKVEQVRDDGFRIPGELALPMGFVEAQCKAFDAAVKAMREAVKAGAVATHYARRIGKTMLERTAGAEGAGEAADPDLGRMVRKEMAAQYLALKDRAWSSVLAHTEAMGKLSSKVKAAAQSQFAEIQALEFSVANVHGFLVGLVGAQPELQQKMLEEVFDCFSRYHADNVLLHRGWISNSRHRTLGMRLKSTRFILPGHARDSGYSSPAHGTLELLRDIDRVFAMLDGKHSPEVSMEDAFSKNYRDLYRGGRVSASYFDLRWYPGAGTLHFFPRRADLVDRLNRFVGVRRAWIPPGDESGNPNFWKQYRSAEKLDKEIRSEVVAARKRRAGGMLSRWEDPVSEALNPCSERRQSSALMLDAAVDAVLERHGLREGVEAEVELARAQLEAGSEVASPRAAVPQIAYVDINA